MSISVSAIQSVGQGSELLFSGTTSTVSTSWGSMLKFDSLLMTDVVSQVTDKFGGLLLTIYDDSNGAYYQCSAVVPVDEIIRIHNSYVVIQAYGTGGAKFNIGPKSYPGFEDSLNNGICTQNVTGSYKYKIYGIK